MRIYKDITFEGARGRIIEKSLIDTGADISLIPQNLATRVGAWHTSQNINVTGVHNQTRSLPIGKIGIFFPSLGNKGGQFLVAVSDIDNEPIIGMDVLKPMGVSIDVKTGELSIKNEVWEAFKTLSAIGIIIFAGIKILDKIFEKKKLID